MASPVVVQDLFAGGLGLDIAGGFLVARGLLTSTVDMATSRTLRGAGAQMTVARARDRTDALLGLTYLGSGFAMQVIGYAAQQAGTRADRTGALEAVGLVSCTLLAIAIALLAHRLLAPAWVRRAALAVTLLDGRGEAVERPDGKELLRLGVELGDDAVAGETYGHYAQRIWSIGDVTDANAQPEDDERMRPPGRRRQR